MQIDDNVEELKNKRRVSTMRRYRLLGFFLLLFILYVFASVLSTIFLHGDRWRAEGEKLNRPERVQIDPIRGNIYAGDGSVVAITAPYYKLYFDFRSHPIRQVGRDSANKLLDSLAYRLETMLSTPEIPLKASELKRRWLVGVKKNSRRWPVLNREISYLQLKELFAVSPLAPEKHHGRRMLRSVLGRSIVEEGHAVRVNPFGSLGRRTIGQVYGATEDGISRGKNGLELGYDSLLSGRPGEGLRVYNAGRYVTNTIREPVRGCDVYTTLDMNAQSVVENALRAMLEKAGAESGTAVLMAVSTGEIKAITNLGRMPNGQYTETMNYAISDFSEPGSTFKTVSLLVALNDGKCRLTDTVDVGSGLWHVAGRVMKDWTVGQRAGFGRISLAKALWQSSNVGIAKMIEKAYGNNPSRFVELVHKTGITENFHLDIPGYATARVRFPNDKTHPWYGTTLPWMAHGYETNVPPIATLAFYNAIANGGRFMRPYFVTKVTASGETIKENRPVVLREQIADPRVISEIKGALRGVVREGTAKSALSPIVQISGKTGTAVINDGGRNYQISFACFFPSEQPRYSLIVVIRKPGVGYTGAGKVCGEVAKGIAEGIIAGESPRSVDSLRLFDHPMPVVIQGGRRQSVEHAMQSNAFSFVRSNAEKKARFVYIHPGSSGETALTPVSQVRRGQMPDVRGLAVSDAVFLMGKAGLRFRVEGFGMVTTQSVSPYEKVAPGTVVTLGLSKEEISLAESRLLREELRRKREEERVSITDLDEAIPQNELPNARADGVPVSVSRAGNVPESVTPQKRRGKLKTGTEGKPRISSSGAKRSNEKPKTNRP